MTPTLHPGKPLRGALALLLLALGACTSGPARAPEGTTLELAVADTGAAFPTTAVDPEDGTVYVAYTVRQAGQADVYLRRLAAGADALAAPVRVNDVAGEAAVHAQAPAQAAVGPDGTVYVAWVTQTPVAGRRFPASDIRLARSVDGGRTFAPAVTVNEAAGFPTSHHFHHLAVGPDGTVYVAWLDGAARDRARQAVAAAVPVAATGHEGAHGGGHGASERDLPGTQLLVARSVDGGRTFAPGVVVADGTCQCCRTALATAPDGTVYVVWRHVFGDGSRDMAIARSGDRGRTFDAPVRVHADGWRIDGCPHAGPSVAVDARGDVHVIWYTGVEGGSGVYYAHRPVGGTAFGPATALAAGVPVAQVGATPSARHGGVLLAWEDPLGDRVQVRHAGAALAPVADLPGAAPSMASGGGTEVLARQDGAQVRLRVTRR